MKRTTIFLILLCLAIGPGKAQLVGPEGPGTPGVHVVQMGNEMYTSLNAAFAAVTTDDQEMRLLTGATLSEATSFAHSLTLDLNGQTLTCASGSSFDIAAGKRLTLRKGVVTGSFALKGEGQLFAGQEVSLTGCGITADATPQSLYRILVTLPDATGPLGSVFYGETIVADASCSRQGPTLCCWLPQSVAARSLSLTFTPAGENSPKNYTTEPLTVTLHAENAVGCKENVAGPEIMVARSKATEGDAFVSHKTLAEAFGQLKTSGGLIELLGSCSLAGQVSLNAPVTLDLKGFSLSGSGNAGFSNTGGGRLSMKNSATSGSVSGAFTLSGPVVIDRSVALSAAMMKSGQQVYRTRLILPDGTTAATFTYGSLKKQALQIDEVEGNQVAYLWLPASSAAPFVLEITAPQVATKTQNNVVILTNHDNVINMQTGGDVEAILYAKGETPGTDPGMPFDTFHDALNKAGKLEASQLWLQTDVAFSGETEHPHIIEAGVNTELQLNGYNLTATNCTLDATASDACLRIVDRKGTGRITGTFRIAGRVYMGEDITASHIGVVIDGSTPSGTQLYRLLARIETTQPMTDGPATWTLGSHAQGTCYVKNRTACLWIPLNAQPETLTLTIGGNDYKATGIQPIATHANTATVKEPAVVATIGSGTDMQSFRSLAEAFTAATTNGDKITLQQSTTLTTLVSISNAVSLDLKEYTLTTSGTAGFTTTDPGSLLIRSTVERGAISGNFRVTAGVCISASVSLTGTVTLGGKTVYRCRLFLPDAPTEASYTYDTQSGPLTFVGETNIDKVVAYAWIEPATGAHDLKALVTHPILSTKTLPDVSIQSNHNNQFHMDAGADMVRVVDGQSYPSIAAALDALNKTDGGTIQLMKDQTLRGMLAVQSNITLDLSGCKLSATADAAIDVEAGKQMLITDKTQAADKGIVYGTLLMNGSVYVSPDINLSGTVVRKEGEVFRCLVTGLPDSATPTLIPCEEAASEKDFSGLSLEGIACLWIPTTPKEQELVFTRADGTLYEATLPASSQNHRTQLKAYRRVNVEKNETWTNETNQDCNVVIAPGVTLTLEAATLNTLHRLTMGKESQVVCSQRVLVTDGITYHRRFGAANVWEAFSLPYEARRVTAVIGKERVDLQPNLANGTGGHFWLKTLAPDGSFNYVAQETLEANRGYIIAVPAELTTQGGGTEMALSFHSPGNQFLRRDAVPVTPPTEGFRLLANGTLRNLPITLPFYLLNAAGTEYERQDASATNPIAISPFSSYLLTDRQTVATQATLRLGELSTANEAMALPTPALKLWNEHGSLVVEAAEETLLTLYTPSGKQILLRRIPAGQTRIPLPAGVYLVNRQKVRIGK